MKYRLDNYKEILIRDTGDRLEYVHLSKITDGWIILWDYSRQNSPTMSAYISGLLFGECNEAKEFFLLVNSHVK